MTTKREKIVEAIEALDLLQLVAVHNEYCDACNDPDNFIYSMEEFDDIMSGAKPWEIARSAFFGGFRPCDDWFRFNGYGNLESSDFPKLEWIYIDDIADYITETGDALGVDEIEQILDDGEAA